MISGYRGLAEAFLDRFGTEGHRLSILVRRTEAVRGIAARFPQSLVCEGDVTDKGAVENWIGETIAKFGRVDCLINNAAIQGPGGKLHELDFSQIETTLQTNLLAPIRLSQLVLPHFEKQNSGMILNLSGGGATAPRAFFAPYALSKVAVVRLTENLAQEYPNLRFYAIAPGAMKTAMMQTVAEMDPTRVGREQQTAQKFMEQGGEDPKRAADLAYWLFENKPASLNGKLISAVWDNYRDAPEHRPEIGWWTLRRIDGVVEKNLRELA